MTITVVAEKLAFARLVRIVTTARRGLATRIVTDPGATYEGTVVDQNSLVAGYVSAFTDVKFGDGAAAQ